MIPVSDVTPAVPSPIPTCAMPRSDEITQEGFGYFRGAWHIGRVRIRDAEAVVRHEAEILEWLDQVASDAQRFELLASAIERADADLVPDSLRTAAVQNGLDRFVVGDSDVDPLAGLEIGVAGLSHALSTVGCLTAASCRCHATSSSWSDCPVVFFAAPAWRVQLLADLVSSERCGLGEDRDMLTVYGASVRDMHHLAQRILVERGRFRRIPDRSRPRPPQVVCGSTGAQGSLFDRT